METKKDVSKKDFIKETAAGDGVTAAAGRKFIGGELADAISDVCEKWSFEVPPPPIPQKEIKKVITADVVVVGAGLAGLSAAGSAAEAGTKTILLEKG